MKYLKRFNERQRHFNRVGIKEIDLAYFRKVRNNIKEKVEEISYILNDIDLSVYVSTGTDCVSIIIDRKYDDPDVVTGPDAIQFAYTDKSYGAATRRWEKSLATNEAYLEFIDRVEEICEEFGFIIYVKSTLNFTDKSTDKHFEFSRLVIDQKAFVKSFVEVKDAIEYETNRGKPGLINKSLTWVGKKLNLI